MIDLLPGVTTTASALTAERIRMEVISQNIANINTTRGPGGGPYRRQQVVFQSILENQLQAGTGVRPQQVLVSRVENDLRPPRLLPHPGHPDADANGMVAVPDINLHEEMADLISASRVFEANLAVMKNARAMALQTLSIGKRS